MEAWTLEETKAEIEFFFDVGRVEAEETLEAAAPCGTRIVAGQSRDFDSS